MSLPVRLRTAVAGAVLSLVFAAIAPAVAQDGDQIVARVNGEAITEADLALAAQDFRDTLGQLPPDQRVMALINGIIDIRLMARAAEAEGLDETDEGARRLAFVRDRALRTEYLRERVFDGITDEAVQALYDEQVQEFEPQEEIRASHILVETEEEARALIAQLDDGADFAELAKTNSLDLGSGAAGGDLDFFGRGRMVPPFEEAAFALEVGAYTAEPVQSNFGWHIIAVTDTRMSSPPPIGQLRGQLEDELARQLFLAALDRLREGAEIEFVAPTADEPAEAPDEAE